MKTIFIISLCLFELLTASVPVQAKDRRVLFEAADDGLSFFIAAAMTNPQLVSQINQGELEVAYQLMDIIDQKKSHDWLAANKIKPMQKDGPWQYYGYVDTRNQVQQVRHPASESPQLVFSSDSKLFKLDPLQPERTAMTYPEFETPIYINLNRINQDNEQINIGAAVSLLIHEYGHKTKRKLELTQAKDTLLLKKYQADVDSLAAKIGSFVQSFQRQKQLSGSRTIFYLQFDFFGGLYKYLQHWMQNGDLAKQTNYLSFMHFFYGFQWPRYAFLDQQGIEIWMETPDRLENLKPALIKGVQKDGLLLHDQDSRFHFAYQNLFLTQSMAFEEDSNGEVQVMWSGIQFHWIIPFLIPDVSPDPQEAQFQQKMWSWFSPFAQFPLNLQLKLGSDLHLLSIGNVNQFMIYDTKVDLIEQKIQDDVLTVRFRVDGETDYLSTVEGGVKKTPLWPSLILVDENRQTIDVKASQYDASLKIYSFQIPRVSRLKTSKLLMKGIEFKFKQLSLVSDNGNLLGKLHFEKAIPLDVQTSLAEASQPVVQMVSVQEGKLVLQINTDEQQVRQVSLNLDYSVSVIRQREDQVKKIASRRRTRWISLNESDFTQTPHQGGVQIVFDLKKNLELSQAIEMQGMIESRQVDEPVQLHELRFVMDSFQQVKVPYERKMDFTNL